MKDEAVIPDLNAEIGELLRLYRVSAGKSEKEIALAARIPKSKVSAYELGRQEISVDCLCRLAAALDVPASELVERIEQRQAHRPVHAERDTNATLGFMASNRGRQLIRAWAQCEEPRLLDAFANLFLAACLQKKTEKAETPRPASTGS